MLRRFALSVGAVAMLLGGSGLVASAAAQPTGGARNEPLSTDAERAQRQAGLELLTYLPSSYDTRCLIQTDDDVAADPLIAEFAGSVHAFLKCRTDDDAISLHAFGLADEDAVNRLYDAYTPEGLDPTAPGCETDGTWGDGRGRYKCYPGEGGGSVVIWTLPTENALFTAFRADSDLAALEAWWETSSPPIDDPPEPTELVSDGEWRANARVLRNSVPERLRRTCEVPAISDDGLGDLYRDRLYLRTALLCAPGKGTDVFYVADFQSSESSDQYVESFARSVDEEAPRAQAGGVDCEGSGTWSRAGNKRAAGDRVCYFSDNGAVSIIWNDRRQGIALGATRDDGDAKKLIRFYNRDAGPLPNPELST